MILAITQRYGSLKNNSEIYYIKKSYQDIFEELDILLVPVNVPNNIKEIVSICDGLIITGGADINPKFYNEQPIDKVNIDNDKNDILDFELIKAFNNAKKPILGICKGLQSINVYFGGTLYQDIKDHKLAKTDGHNVKIIKDSSIYDCYKKENLLVNSFHHQAIKELAEGFKVTAISEDGIIEGIEKENIIAVQWHPERMNDIRFFKFIIEKISKQSRN